MSNSNYYIVARSLKSLFGLQCPTDDIEDVMAELDRLPEYRAPFKMSETVVMIEREPVIPQILSPRRAGNLIQQLMSMDEGEVVLITDAVVRGKEGLFFVTYTDCDDAAFVAREWLQTMRTPKLMIGHLKPNFSIIAAPASAFA